MISMAQLENIACKLRRPSGCGEADFNDTISHAEWIAMYLGGIGSKQGRELALSHHNMCVK